MSSEIFKKPLPYLALLIAHLIWGANFVVAKISLEQIPVMSLGFLRFALAFLLIAPFLITLPKEERKIKIEHLPRLFLVGVFMISINIVFFYEGMLKTSAINASVLSMSIPIISVIGGWWFLKEKIYLTNLVGIVLGLIGAVTIIGLPLLIVDGLNKSMMLGNLLILLSSASFVIGSILSKDLLKIYSPLVTTAFAFLVGAITFFIPAIFDYIQNPSWVLNLNVLGVLGLLYITILSSIVAFFLMVWGLSKTNVIQANLFQYIEPAIAATLAVPILGERISYSFIVGTCLVVLGTYWGSFGKPHHHHPHHKHHRT